MRTHGADLRYRPRAGAFAQHHAHAGFLSFEMSSANCPMIVNCSSPSLDHEDGALRPLDGGALDLDLRVVLGGFTAGGTNGSAVAPIHLTGPANAQAALTDQGDNLRIKGSHDGYGQFRREPSRQFLVAPNDL
jgi:uncharacterized heparinase superfamily protein